MYEVVRNSDMTYVRSQLLPEIMTTRSTVSPVESWLRDSWKSEFSSLDEAELEIDAGAAGVAYRDITIFIVDRIMAPQSSSLSVDEIELLFDNEL